MAPLPVRAAAPLGIIHVGIRQIEDGPAVGDRVSFVPGETVYVSFDVQNYALSKEDAAAISWVIKAVDPKGVLIFPPVEAKKVATLQPEDKDWMPRVRQSIEIPSPAPGGSYSVHIDVKDLNSEATASADTKFSVTGPLLEPSAALAVIGFGFFRSEDAPQPLELAAYRTGDSMHARFRIAGFKYGAGNAIEVNYGISILGPAGNVMYTQDPAVEEKSASFYPKPYVDGIMSLSLNPGTPAGEYTLLITGRDKVGNQTVEIRKPFRIE
jgi:hypothetical protein